MEDNPNGELGVPLLDAAAGEGGRGGGPLVERVATTHTPSASPRGTQWRRRRRCASLASARIIHSSALAEYNGVLANTLPPNRAAERNHLMKHFRCGDLDRDPQLRAGGRVSLWRRQSHSTWSKVAPAVVAVPAKAMSAPPTAVVDADPAKVPPAAAATAEQKTEEEAHFDVAQNVYTTVKSIWSWGRTVPVLTNVLGIYEAVAANVLDTAVHMDLLAIDRKAVTPQLKNLDDNIVTPIILTVWKMIEPAVAKGNEMVVKPVQEEVVPQVLATLGMFDGTKDEADKKRHERMIDMLSTPEVVPALS